MSRKKPKNRVWIIECWTAIGQRGKQIRRGWVPWSIGYDYRAAVMELAEQRAKYRCKFRITRYEAAR